MSYQSLEVVGRLLIFLRKFSQNFKLKECGIYIVDPSKTALDMLKGSPSACRLPANV